MQVIPRISIPTFGVGNWLLLALAAVLAILFVRFALAYSRRNDAGEAFANTGRWAYVAVGGVLSALFMAVAQFGDIIAQITGFIAGHPFFASNFGAIGLGWLSLSGQVTLGATEYVLIAATVVGVIFIVQGVDDFA